MADSGIKQVTINRNTLPPVIITNNRMYYFLRYRITSEDKNRQSHWSPIYKILFPKVNSTGIQFITTIDPGLRRTDWTLPDSLSYLSNFDIYYRYKTVNVNNPFGPWTFAGTISNTTFSFVIPSDLVQYEIAVQIPTYPKIRYADATLFTDTV